MALSIEGSVEQNTKETISQRLMELTDEVSRAEQYVDLDSTAEKQAQELPRCDKVGGYVQVLSALTSRLRRINAALEQL
jgi:hypothetical protein